MGIERLFYRGPFELNAGGTIVYEINRDLRQDAVNLSLTLAVRTALR